MNSNGLNLQLTKAVIPCQARNDEKEETMWTFEMNRCVGCMKIEECPDAKIIQKTLRKLLDAVENNEGGSSAGVIVVVCKDKDLG